MHILAFQLFEWKQSDQGVVRCKSFVYAFCKLCKRCKPDLEQGIILINMWYYHYKGWYRKAKTIMKLSKPHLVWSVQLLGVVKVYVRHCNIIFIILFSFKIRLSFFRLQNILYGLFTHYILSVEYSKKECFSVFAFGSLNIFY